MTVASASGLDDLPDGVARWVGETLGGRLVHVERHIHPRPMWFGEVACRGGERIEVYLRGERGPGSALASVYDLAREASVVGRVGAAGVPTPKMLGFSAELGVMIMERVHGRSDAHLLDGPERDAVSVHFMEVLADLHRLDVEELAIPGLDAPGTPEEYALGELWIAERLFDASDTPPEPFVTYARRWLRDHVPTSVERPVLVQGDTGPGNFMFDGSRVAYLVDWEMAHLGDPMEDLAAVCVRDMVTPFADLPAAFAAYAARSGSEVDLARVRYHRVSKCARSLIAISSYVHRATRPDEVALWNAWRALYLRSGCQAILEAEGGEWEGGPAHGDHVEPDPWYDIVISHLKDTIEPTLSSEFVRHQLDGAIGLLQVLEGDAGRSGGDEDDLSALLGGDVASVDAGLASLNRRIEDDSLDAAEILAYLSRRAERLTRRYRPIMGDMADNLFNPIV